MIRALVVAVLIVLALGGMVWTVSAETTLVRTGGWVLLTDSRALQTFGSEAACRAEVVAWAGRARDGARWVEMQYRAAPTAFWSSAVQRASDQVERARSAKCVERERS